MRRVDLHDDRTGRPERLRLLYLVSSTPRPRNVSIRRISTDPTGELVTHLHCPLRLVGYLLLSYTLTGLVVLWKVCG